MIKTDCKVDAIDLEEGEGKTKAVTWKRNIS